MTKYLKSLARPRGFEPRTVGLEEVTKSKISPTLRRNFGQMGAAYFSNIFAFVLMVALSVVGLVGAQSPRPVARWDWTPQTRLDLARSCVGEAGFDSGRTGECAAIAWVYAVRVEQARARGRRISYRYMVNAYSQPLKTARRPWVLRLRGPERPRGLPRAWPWEERLAGEWAEVLERVDAWASGAVPNPCPGANHFGSVQDGAPAAWTRISCATETRNLFWSSR